MLAAACQAGAPTDDGDALSTIQAADTGADFPVCVDRGCNGACGAGCSPATCSCDVEIPTHFDHCEGTTGVYVMVSAYLCYTSACCQEHDNCLGSNPATCLTDDCVDCDVVAILQGCAGCIGLGFPGCSSGGTWGWFDENPRNSFVSNDPRCQSCNVSSCDATCQNGQGGHPWLAGTCNGGSCGSCVCDPGRCSSYCAQQGRGDGSCSTLGDSSGCTCNSPTVCTVSCATNCGQPADVPAGCPPTNCPTDTCESLGQTTGSVCGVPCGPPPCNCPDGCDANGNCLPPPCDCPYGCDASGACLPPWCDPTCYWCGTYNDCGDYCGDCGDPGSGDPGGGDPGGGGGGDECWDGSTCEDGFCWDGSECGGGGGHEI